VQLQYAISLNLGFFVVAVYDHIYNLDQGRMSFRMPLTLSDRVLVNGTYACDSDKLMNGLLKTELAFQGCESHSQI